MTTFRPTLRLAADYECHPVWRRRPDGGLDNLDPQQLELPDTLKDALDQWARVFDSTLVPSDPIRSGFATPLEEDLFAALGNSLAAWIAQSMSEAVDFFDPSSRSHVVVAPPVGSQLLAGVFGGPCRASETPSELH